MIDKTLIFYFEITSTYVGFGIEIRLQIFSINLSQHLILFPCRLKSGHKKLFRIHFSYQEDDITTKLSLLMYQHGSKGHGATSDVTATAIPLLLPLVDCSCRGCRHRRRHCHCCHHRFFRSRFQLIVVCATFSPWLLFVEDGGFGVCSFLSLLASSLSLWVAPQFIVWQFGEIECFRNSSYSSV